VSGVVAAGDTDVADTLTYSASTPGKGSVVVADDGSFVYTPSATARHNAAADGATADAGRDEFTITVTDGHGGQVAVPVAVVIAPANAAPTGTVTVGKPAASGLVSGTVAASDADSADDFTFTASTPAKGSVVVAGDGSFVYTPSSPRQAGVDGFTVTVSDGHGGVVAVPVSVVIAAANTTPVNTWQTGGNNSGGNKSNASASNASASNASTSNASAASTHAASAPAAEAAAAPAAPAAVAAVAAAAPAAEAAAAPAPEAAAAPAAEAASAPAAEAASAPAAEAAAAPAAEAAAAEAAAAEAAASASSGKDSSKNNKDSSGKNSATPGRNSAMESRALDNPGVLQRSRMSAAKTSGKPFPAAGEGGDGGDGGAGGDGGDGGAQGKGQNKPNSPVGILATLGTLLMAAIPMASGGGMGGETGGGTGGGTGGDGDGKNDG